MSECIDTVTNLMPSSSSFQDSDVQEILDETIGVYFDNKEEEIEELIDAPLLTEADGDYLDLLHGRLYSISRKLDETDDDYRLRLSFQAKDELKIPDLQELGCDVYTYVDDFDPVDTLVSRNAGLTMKVIIESPSLEVEDLVKDNFIHEGMVVFI